MVTCCSIFIDPSAPSQVFSFVNSTAIIISFAAPPSGTAIEVVGMGPTELFGNVTGSSIVFTNITLGEPYNFTLVAIDGTGLTSNPFYLLDVTGV